MICIQKAEKCQKKRTKHRTDQKRLTIKNKSGNIIKLSARETPKESKKYEKLQKKKKKVLDKNEAM